MPSSYATQSDEERLLSSAEQPRSSSYNKGGSTRESRLSKLFSRRPQRPPSPEPDEDTKTAASRLVDYIEASQHETKVTRDTEKAKDPTDYDAIPWIVHEAKRVQAARNTLAAKETAKEALTNCTDLVGISRAAKMPKDQVEEWWNKAIA